MPTLTSKAIYQDGVVIPEIHPSLAPREVVVVFIEPETLPKSRQEKTLKILKNTFGAWSKGPSGIDYENKIRAEAEEHFKNL